MTTTDTPNTIRQLDTADAHRLARLVAAYDDLQTMLSCCERLVPLVEADATGAEVEALWTLALFSYARLFAEKSAGAHSSDSSDGSDFAPLSEDDVAGAVGDSAKSAQQSTDSDGDPDFDPRQWHQVFLHLRDHYASAVDNPRETFTTGVALDSDGAVNAVAVSSVRTPALDVGAVRRAGAMAYPLLSILDQRIEEIQRSIMEQMRAANPEDLAALAEIAVTAPE